MDNRIPPNNHGNGWRPSFPNFRGRGNSSRLKLFHRRVFTGHANNNHSTPEMIAFAKRVTMGIPGELAYYTPEMLGMCREIIELLPGENHNLDPIRFRPNQLVPILKERLKIFFLSSDFILRNNVLSFWISLRNAYDIMDICSSLIRKAEAFDSNSIKKEMICKEFADLQDCILEIVNGVPLLGSIIQKCYIGKKINIKDENGRTDGLRYLLDDLLIFQSILNFNLIDEKGQVILKELQRQILELLLEEFNIGDRNTFHRMDKIWTLEDFEFLGELYECVEQLEFHAKKELIAQLKYLLVLELRNPEAFKASTKTAFIRVLEKLPIEEQKRNDFFSDELILRLLFQFQQIMSESPASIVKNYHCFKLNCLKFFKHRYQVSDSIVFRSPTNIAKMCWFCVSEISDVHYKENPIEMDGIIVGIINILIKHVKNFQRNATEAEKNVCRSSPESYLLLPHLHYFLILSTSLLQPSLRIDGILQTIPVQIDLSAHPAFNDLVANSICSRESLFSDVGSLLINRILHPDIQCFAKEYWESDITYIKCYENQTIPEVPEYVKKEIVNNKSISRKSMKAILFGLECGWSESSAILKHWRKDWVNAVTQLHPEVAETPELFFKHIFMEELDQDAKVFAENIAKDFGEPDIVFHVGKDEIQVHKKVIKSFCSSLENNFFSALLSEKYKLLKDIYLDQSDECAGTLTYRGLIVHLMLMYDHINREKIQPCHTTFIDEGKYLFPEMNFSILLDQSVNITHLKELFYLHFEHLLKVESITNLSRLADFIADLYMKTQYGELTRMCRMAIGVSEKNKIHIPGGEEYLIELVQSTAYPQLDSSHFIHRQKDYFQFCGYHAEYLEKGVFWELFDHKMFNVVFPLGEVGKARFRNKVFNILLQMDMKKSLTYEELNAGFVKVIHLLSFIEVKKLTKDESDIISDLVVVLPGKLPKLMLDTDARIDLKNNFQKNLAEFNKKLGTHIKFEIDFGNTLY